MDRTVYNIAQPQTQTQTLNGSVVSPNVRVTYGTGESKIDTTGNISVNDSKRGEETRVKTESGIGLRVMQRGG